MNNNNGNGKKTKNNKTLPTQWQTSVNLAFVQENRPQTSCEEKTTPREKQQNQTKQQQQQSITM